MTRDHLEETRDPALDKSKWRAGRDEPDRVEWRYKGVPCLLVRGPTGAWCGYVAASPGHPWHGVDMSMIERVVGVHGGVTFAGECSGHICHVPREGEPEHVFWIGFDCAHAGDFSPALDADLRSAGFESRLGRLDRGPLRDIYRAQPYAMREVERVAEQILAADPLQP